MDDSAAALAAAACAAGLTLGAGLCSIQAAPRQQAAVTEEDVLQVQKKWAQAIVSISAKHKDGGDFVKAAGDAAGELYAYGHADVLFKPTKAAEYQFRPTAGEAMSYFIGGAKWDGGYAEDGGFAINGGKRWASCVYDNHKVVIKNGIGMAIGNYFFTCATTGDEVKVEYTFGYQRCEIDGKVRIFLHHSSVPYVSAKTISDLAADPAKLDRALKKGGSMLSLPK